MPKNRLSPELVTSHPKKAKTYYKVQIVNLEEDEEKTQHKKFSCGDDEKPQVKITQADFENEYEVNIKQVIKNIQIDEPIKHVI